MFGAELHKEERLTHVSFSVGFYTVPNGRGPLAISGLNSQKPNNIAMYGQKSSFDQNNYQPTRQYPSNQYGTGYYRMILQK